MTSSEIPQLNKLKSLKDILLERSVVNFDKVFLDVDQRKRKVVKKEICLPKGLFELIQSKSSEICWPIPHEHLKVCLSNREALNWTYVNLTYGLLCEENLLKIKSEFPVKQLSFRTCRMTNVMMNFIEKIAPNIEILEIMYNLPNSFEKDPAPEVILRRRDPVRFPKLKKLLIDTWPIPPNLLQRFDLKSCSESLKHLSLHHPRGSVYGINTSFCLFVESFKCLQNLQTLSMTACYEYPELLDVIVHLKNLRTLDIPYIKFTNPNKIRILEVLPQLRNIMLYVYDLSDELRYLKNRRLDLLSAYHPIPKELRHLSKKTYAISYEYGESEVIWSLLHHANNLTTYLSMIRPTQDLENFIRSGVEMLQKMTTYQLQNFEQVILVCIRWQHDDIEMKHIAWAFYFSASGWSQTFLIKIANLVVNTARYTKAMSIKSCYNLNDLLWRIHWEPSGYNLYNLLFDELIGSQRLKSIMLDYIILNPRSALAKMYLKHLITPTALDLNPAWRITYIKNINYINNFDVTSLKWNLNNNSIIL